MMTRSVGDEAMANKLIPLELIADYHVNINRHSTVTFHLSIIHDNFEPPNFRQKILLTVLHILRIFKIFRHKIVSATTTEILKIRSNLS